jgi:hypothetical protein
MKLEDSEIYTREKIYLLIGKIVDKPSTLYVEKYNMVVGEHDTENSNMGTLEKKVLGSIVLDYTGNDLNKFGTSTRIQYMNLLEEQWKNSFIRLQLEPFIKEFMPKCKDWRGYGDSDNESEDDYYRGNIDEFLKR